MVICLFIYGMTLVAYLDEYCARDLKFEITQRLLFHVIRIYYTTETSNHSVPSLGQRRQMCVFGVNNEAVYLKKVLYEITKKMCPIEKLDN